MPPKRKKKKKKDRQQKHILKGQMKKAEGTEEPEMLGGALP
jgi:hypothetical protein